MEKLTLGSYGVVYKAKSIANGHHYAIKRILPTLHANYILMEALFLQLLKYGRHLIHCRGKSHIIELVEGIRDNTQVSFVFKYVKATSFYVFRITLLVLDIVGRVHDERHKELFIPVAECY